MVCALKLWPYFQCIRLATYRWSTVFEEPLTCNIGSSGPELHGEHTKQSSTFKAFRQPGL